MQDLAGRGPGHFLILDKVHGLGSLETGDLVLCGFHDLFGQVFARFDIPGWSTTIALTISPHLVSGMPMTATSLTALWLADDPLHLGGIDILAARDDHVGLPVDEGVIPVLIALDHVAGRRPFAEEGLFAFLRLLEVFLEQHGRAVEELAHLAVRNLLPVLVQDLDPVCSEDLLADGTEFLELIFRPQKGHQILLPCFRKPPRVPHS